MSACLPASLPRIPEPLATVALRQPSLLVVVLPAGNRRLSKDEFSPVLATRQGLDFGDHTPPQSMDRSNAAAERERRLVCGHPVPSLRRWQWATTASPFWGCTRGLVRLVERDARVHIFRLSFCLLRRRCDPVRMTTSRKSVFDNVSSPLRGAAWKQTCAVVPLKNIRADLGTAAWVTRSLHLAECLDS